MKQIVHLMVKRTMREVESQGYIMTTTDAAKEKIAEDGFDPQYGARPLRRAIQKLIEDPLAEEFIRNAPEPGSTIAVGFDKDKGELTFDIKAPEKKEPAKEAKDAKEASNGESKPKAAAAPEKKKAEEKAESAES